MANKNVFEDFQAKKQEVLRLAKKAAEFGWITKGREAEIAQKIESDVLTIGVIGQMKCGKSTFLNAFVFEDDVLPAATTPMTAALTVVTYGAQKKIAAEFYSKDEWEEQKVVASRNADEVNDEVEQSKVKAAQELVEKSRKLGNSLQQYLGKTQNDSLENLVEYVGADGKFVSITKSVKIFFPKDYLKGVEIVDTPGMNDPIVSREERTKEFLKRADVVLAMLYAGRPFDATDHAILFENVRKCGIGKVLIGVNKYDIPYMNGDSEDEIRNYVEEEIRKACSDYHDDSIAEIMAETKPVLLSAGMALLSELPMGKISANESYKFDWNKFCENFEISTQPQFKEKSHIDILSNQVIDMIENEKGEILFKKPKNEIRAAAENKKLEIEKNLTETKNKLKILEMPDEDLDEKLEGIEKAERRMNKKLDRLESDIKEKLDETIPVIKHKMEDDVDSACKKMYSAVDSWQTRQFITDNVSEIENDINRIRNSLVRSLNRDYVEKAKSLKKEIRNEISACASDISDISVKYISDFEFGDFIETLKSKIQMDLEDKFRTSDTPYEVLNGMWQKDLGFRTATKAEAIKKSINEFQASFSFDAIAASIESDYSPQIGNIKKLFANDIFSNLKQSIDECKKNKSDREKEIEKAKKQCEVFENKKQELQKQLKEIENL